MKNKKYNYEKGASADSGLFRKLMKRWKSCPHNSSSFPRVQRNDLLFQEFSRAMEVNFKLSGIPGEVSTMDTGHLNKHYIFLKLTINELLKWEIFFFFLHWVLVITPFFLYKSSSQNGYQKHGPTQRCNYNCKLKQNKH